MHHLLFFSFIPLCLVSSVSVNAVSTCWYPDGITTEPAHVPCNQTTNAASTCCAPRDACAGGLCLSINGPYRGSCTDQSWNSPGCGAREWPQCLTDSSTRRRYNQIAPLLSCSAPGTDGPNVCCGYSNGSSCCNEQFRPENMAPAYSPGLDVLVTGLSSSSGSNMTNITTVPAGSNDNIGAKIGLGVGIPLGVFFTGILGFLFYREYNKSKILSPPATLASAGNPLVSMEQQRFYPEYSAAPNYTASHPPQQPMTPTNTKSEPVYEAPMDNVHEMRG